MKLLRYLRHLFLPHESNNHKAKILHSSSLFLVIGFLLLVQLVLSFLPKFSPSILGFAANIPPAEIIRLTNEKRAQNGLPALNLNAQLSQSAQAKGADMLNKGYWAHVAPDGTTPWVFITNSGYKYRYAGENLARDFSNPSAAVEAWMNSPSHKENLLSAKYKEIGVAVVEGQLAGVETTIIVQHFGAKFVDTIPAVPVAEAKAVIEITPVPTQTEVKLTPTQTVVLTPVPEVKDLTSKPLVSPFTATKGVSIAIVAVLLLVLLVDWLVISHKKIVRVGGRNFAHLAFLGMIIAIILILRAGKVL